VDANNVEWYIEGEDSGYPAGDFGDALFDGLLQVAPLQRLRALTEIYALADDNNLGLLDRGFPHETGGLLQSYYDGDITEVDALHELRHVLAVLPFLLVMTFPQLRGALLEYARRDIK